MLFSIDSLIVRKLNDFFMVYENIFRWLSVLRNKTFLEFNENNRIKYMLINFHTNPKHFLTYFFSEIQHYSQYNL